MMTRLGDGRTVHPRAVVGVARGFGTWTAQRRLRGLKGSKKVENSVVGFRVNVQGSGSGTRDLDRRIDTVLVWKSRKKST